MKKKLFLCVAVILIAVTACALLVGCAKSPEEFATSFNNSDSRFMTHSAKFESDGEKSWEKVECGINGNIYVETYESGDGDGTSLSKDFIELQKDKVVMYAVRYENGKVTDARKRTLTLDEAIEWFEVEGGKINSISDLVGSDFEGIDIEEFELEKNFTKKGNKYIGKKDSDYEDTVIEMTSKEMIVTVSHIDESYKVIYTTKYGTGYGKITIPKEALNAEEGDY